MQRVPDLPWPTDLYRTDEALVCDADRWRPALIWINPQPPARRGKSRASLRLVTSADADRQAPTQPYQRSRWRVANMLP